MFLLLIFSLYDDNIPNCTSIFFPIFSVSAFRILLLRIPNMSRVYKFAASALNHVGPAGLVGTTFEEGTWLGAVYAVVIAAMGAVAYWGPKWGGRSMPLKATAPLALVIAPTRELALQVSRELQWLYAPTHARIATCVGGIDPSRERRTLQGGAHIVVGTPGRLLDHLRRGTLTVQHIRTVVLDEADEMFERGFAEDIEATADARAVIRIAALARQIAPGGETVADDV